MHCYIQGDESSDFNLNSDFFALHKTPFSDFYCIEEHIFSGISEYFRLFRTDALTPPACYGYRTTCIILVSP